MNWPEPTVTASTMSAQGLGCGQGRMSQPARGNSRAAVAPHPPKKNHRELYFWQESAAFASYLSRVLIATLCLLYKILVSYRDSYARQEPLGPPPCSIDDWKTRFGTFALSQDLRETTTHGCCCPNFES